MRKLNINEVEQILDKSNKDKQFSWNLSEYKTMNDNIPFICKKCNKTFNRKPTVFAYRNNTCPYCNGKPRNYTYTTDEFITKANQIHENKYDYSKSIYLGSDKKIEVICHEKDEFEEEHGSFFVTPHAHIGIMHSGCPKCSKKYGSQELFIKKAENLYKGLYTYEKSIYKGALKYLTVTCKKHGDFITKPNWFINGHNGCPKCNQSYLEQIVQGMLDENKIESIYYATKKHLPWLDKLSLDFYLPQYNIAIECQGLQHFKPIDYFNQTATFETLQKRDELKKELCEQHGVKLLYFTNIKKYINNDNVFDINHLLSEITKHEKTNN